MIVEKLFVSQHEALAHLRRMREQSMLHTVSREPSCYTELTLPVFSTQQIALLTSQLINIFQMNSQ